MKKRLMQYDNDILHWEDYDYIVINNDLEKCFSQIEQIIKKSQKRKNVIYLIFCRIDLQFYSKLVHLIVQALI